MNIANCRLMGPQLPPLDVKSMIIINNNELYAEGPRVKLAVHTCGPGLFGRNDHDGTMVHHACQADMYRIAKMSQIVWAYIMTLTATGVRHSISRRCLEKVCCVCVCLSLLLPGHTG